VPGYTHTTTNLNLTVKELRQESKSCFTVILKRPPNFTYHPGDWVDFGFERGGGADVKTFSFSSSPTEPDLALTFKVGLSPFKKKLQAVKKDDILYVTQYGNSGFTFDPRYKAIFIAGGIGIAPFRSMLQEYNDLGLNVDIILIYQSHADDIPFRDELDRWANAHSSLHVHYLDSTTKGRLKKKALLQLAPPSTKAMYYIVGPPAMVETTETFLLQAGVAPQDIADDSFTGY
jgi:ferredoxin-NADP reductase